MAFTDADLTAVRTALTKGERVVQYADRSVTYRSVEELLQVEQRILRELTPSTTARSKQTFLVGNKGF